MAASPHGTEARYGAGCRCEACRGAHAERMRRYRARRRGEVPRFAGRREVLPPPERWEGPEGASEEVWTPEPRGALGALGAAALGTLVLAIAARRRRGPSPEPRPARIRPLPRRAPSSEPRKGPPPGIDTSREGQIRVALSCGHVIYIPGPVEAWPGYLAKCLCGEWAEVVDPSPRGWIVPPI